MRTVGDRIEAWEEVLRRWAARPDWNPRNIAGMLDRFRQQTEPEEPEPELEPDTRQLRVIDPEELDRQLREIIEKADSMVANRGDGS